MTHRGPLLVVAILAVFAIAVGSGIAAGQQAKTTEINEFEPNLEGEDSQEAQIDITVVDTNGNAIEGALVELEDRGGSPDERLATTGSDGQIRFIEGTGTPPENCQTAKLHMADGSTRSADLGCRNGGESTSHTFQADRTNVETDLNKVNPNVDGEDSQEAQIDITVVDTNGNAIEGALVELEDRGGSPDYRMASTGSDGRIRFVESTGPPPENCQTAKLRMADGTTRSADLGCRNGGESTSHTFQVESQSDPPTDPAPESATVTAGTVNLQDAGDTAETAVSIDASGGISGVDVTVSVDSPNVEIAGASATDERAGIQDLTGDSVNITFTEVLGSRQQIELADVRFEATGEVQNRVDITLDVPFARVDETNDVDVTTESGTILSGDSPFGQPLIPGFASPPQNTGELDATLYEDLDGDGDGTEVTPAVQVFAQLIRGNDLGLTSTQAAKLDWDRDNDGSVDVDDIVDLFGQKIRAG